MTGVCSQTCEYAILLQIYSLTW